MRLAEWSAHPIRLPYGRSIQWGSTGEDAAEYLLLRLVGDDATVGLAEVHAKMAWHGVNPSTLAVILEEQFIPVLRHIDLLDEDAVSRVLARIPEQRLARALVDSACWDLRSQARGAPLWQIWGGDSEATVSWTVTRQKPAAMTREAAEMVARYWFRTLKVKGGQGRDVDRTVLTEIRAAVGPDVALYVDANGAYQPSEAPAYLNELAELSVFVAEDPCQLQPNDAFRKLQEESPIPILVDRGCGSTEDAALFLDHGARALSLKLGGIGATEAFAMASMAHQQRCAAHVGSISDSSLGAMFSLQVASALPGREYSLPAETSLFLTLAEEYVVEPLRVVDGKVRLPDTPGLARWVDWERVASLQP